VRIVFLHPVGNLGGAERALLDMLAELRRLVDWELFLVLGDDGPLRTEAESLGVGCQVLPMPGRLQQLGDSAWAEASPMARFLRLGGRALTAGLDALGYRRRLQRALADLRPQLVFSNGLKSHLLCALLRPPVPVVWYLHDFISARPLARRLIPWAGRRVALVLANSRATADDLAALVPAMPVQVLYQGIDTDCFSPGPGDGAELDRRGGLEPAGDVVRIGLVAAYARWKGQDLFLESAGRLLAVRPGLPVRFFLVGGAIYQTDGSQFSEAELRALAAGRGLAGRVGFVPFQSSPAEVYRALDVVVHCSRRPEPFGRVIVEAMSCGRAVIACRPGGAAEIFTPGHDALGIPANDAAALAEAIERLADDPELRRRLGQAGRQTVLERFCRPRMGRDLADICQRLAGPHSPRDATAAATGASG
jgi:glycosyltransferase involved in cell wall biosynthesis